MSAISSKAAGGVENKKKYNGIELDTDLELNVSEADFRDLDQQTGRWWQIDPKIEDMEMWSPYASNFDNPIKFKDPKGDEPVCCPVASGIIQRGERATAGLNPATAEAIELGTLVTAGVVALYELVAELDYKGVAAPPVAGSSPAVVGNSYTMGTSSGAFSSGASTWLPPQPAGTAIQNIGTGAASVAKQFGGKSDTESSSGKAALRNAKDQNGIPRSQQPDKTIKPNTPDGDKSGLDSRNKKQYEFTNSKGEKVVIRQDKPASYPDGGTQPPHFNAGENPSVPKDLNQHHNYFYPFVSGSK
jgi:RHS repeat-associated protein